MNTVKDISKITGVSIRTLRYYDEIGLLKPTKLSDAGYRLYDSQALEKLQEIMFFRELQIPLADIKKIIESPDYDKKRALLTQKALLEQKRNRLNGIIELITDVMEGNNTMSFEAFTNEEISKILDHTLEHMPKETLAQQAKQYGSIQKYRDSLAAGFANDQNVSDIFKWYGGKEKALEAAMQSIGDSELFKPAQDENTKIYHAFMQAKKTNNTKMAAETVERLAETYKKMFNLDNARNILLDLANEYLQNPQLAEANDLQFGKGCSEYAAKAILAYYGK